ncbi:uncharacterized protein VNE69_06050 [Vairimorpha necatrix]|uniref:Uncharacterized protein n=1 Tax=Vairimorpha necatrix TaxID=6039 RepID=A0AAX4JCQ4_9MICR
MEDQACYNTLDQDENTLKINYSRENILQENTPQENIDNKQEKHIQELIKYLESEDDLQQNKYISPDNNDISYETMEDLDEIVERHINMEQSKDAKLKKDFY